MTDDDDLDPVERMNREEERQVLDLADLERMLEDAAAAFERDPLRELWFGDNSD